MTTTINSDINAFITAQSAGRGSDGLAEDYNALTGTVPAGGNSVYGVAEIATDNYSPVTLSGSYNSVIFDGSHSSNASTVSPPDNYSFAVDASGTLTVYDDNTTFVESISNVSYLVFNGGATNSNGTFQSLYIIASGTHAEVNAEIASLYSAAFERIPDLQGLEFWENEAASGMSIRTIANYFLASPEFATDYSAAAKPADDGGPNDQAFIAALYQNVLHRTPSTGELDYYISALQGTLAGAPQETRADVLLNFAMSPENQTAISSWLINTNVGGYADANMQLPATTVLEQGLINQYINTALITTTTDASGYVISPDGGFTDVQYSTAADIATTEGNLTLVLSKNLNVGYIGGNNDTVYGYASGSSYVYLPSTYENAGTVNGGGKVYLQSTGNIIVTDGGFFAGVTTPTTVYGFGTGDILREYIVNDTIRAAQILTGSSSAVINGASLDFVNSNGTTNLYAINVGNVSGTSAAAMASAANAVYKVGDVAHEQVLFIGQDAAGDTVVYHWTGGDINHTHLVDASAFYGAEILVGIAPSAITTTMLL